MKRILAFTATALLFAACSSTPKATPTPPETETGLKVGVTVKDFAMSLDKSSIAAGKITFAVKNDGPTVHEFVIFKSDPDPASMPLESGSTDVDEEGAGVKHISEIEDIAAGATQSLEQSLDAGKYVLLCNLPGHYKLGMYTGLTVT